MRRWLVLLWVAVLTPVAFSAGTVTWELNNYSDFIRGRFTGISLSRDGRLRLAPKTDTLFASDQPVIWSMVQGTDGTLYAGTGHRGRVYQVDKAGKASVLWTSDQPEVFALAVDSKGTVYAATSPNGKVYRIQNGKASEFFSPKSTYIWSLAFGKDGALFVGTGDQGTIYRVDATGKSEVYYETGQAHITCLAVDAKGRLLAGSEPNGILYRIEGRDRAFVLYDASLPEIRAISVAADGAIYAAAQGGASMRRALAPATSYPAGPAGSAMTASPTSVTVTEDMTQGGIELKPRADAAKPAAPATPQVTAQFAPVSDFPGVEKSALYKILTDNTVETLWSSKDENVYDLVESGDQIIFSTDALGRVHRLAPDGKVTLLVQTNEGEATRLLQSPRGLLAATGDLGKIFVLQQDTGTSGTFESPVHDAGTVARWGRLSWLAETCRGCGLAFRTRTGNSLRPDPTWSDWSEPLKDPTGSQIPSPNARYVQWQAEFGGSSGASPILDSVTLAYLPQNTAPAVRNISVTTLTGTTAPKPPATQAVSSSYSVTVTADGSDSGPATSAGTPTQSLARSSVRQLQIAWQADDPNNDRLSFSLHFRGEGEQEWKLIKANLQDSSLTLDGDILADGKYFFRVTASDLPSNPGSTAKEAELTSPPVLVDNTPPLVSAGVPKSAGAGFEIDFDAIDAASPLRRAEYSVDAGIWTPAEAADGIFDSMKERVVVRLGKLAPGEHLVVLRVYDSAENAGLAKVVLK
jgi:outer membrane protein assembly factor BamB